MGVLHIFGHPLLLVFGVLVTWLPCDESDGDHVLKAPFTEFKNASIMFGQVHTGLCEHSSQDSVPARALQGGSSAGGGSASAVRVVVSAIMVMVPVVVFVVVALNYETGVVDQRPQFPSAVPPEWSMQNSDFRFDLFRCFDDCQVCMHGFIFGECRDADTYNAAGVATYWSFIWIACLVLFLTNVLGVATQVALGEAVKGSSSNHITQASNSMATLVMQFFFSMYLASLRQQLRKKLGGHGNKTAMDFLCYWCCPWCIVCQNARQIDGIQNIEVQCCCKVVKSGGLGITQQNPVVVGQVLVQQPPQER